MRFIREIWNRVFKKKTLNYKEVRPHGIRISAHTSSYFDTCTDAFLNTGLPNEEFMPWLKNKCETDNRNIYGEGMK